MEDKIKTKVCTKCNAEFPATNEFFREGKGNKNGLRANCRICDKQYKKDNAEHIIERNKQYRVDNAERIAEYAKQYRQDNKERNKQYYIDNAEQICERMKRYYIENLEQIVARNKEYGKQYREAHPEQNRLKTHRYSAMKRSLISDFTLAQWESCLMYFDYKDAYTGLPLESPSQDHVTPLSKGGNYTVSNIVPCNCIVNSSKGNRDMSTWFRKQPYYDIERENKILAYLGHEA